MKEFKESLERVDDDNPSSGQPLTSQIDENVTGLRDVLNSNRRMSSVRFGRHRPLRGRSGNVEENGLSAYEKTLPLPGYCMTTMRLATRLRVCLPSS